MGSDSHISATTKRPYFYFFNESSSFITELALKNNNSDYYAPASVYKEFNCNI